MRLVHICIPQNQIENDCLAPIPEHSGLDFFCPNLNRSSGRVHFGTRRDTGVFCTVVVYFFFVESKHSTVGPEIRGTCLNLQKGGECSGCSKSAKQEKEQGEHITLRDFAVDLGCGSVLLKLSKLQPLY